MTQRRVLVIGVGSIGERHTRCFLKTGRGTVGIVETNAALRAQVAERYSIANAYDSLDRALQDSFDAAVICTPANTHVPIAIQLAQAGVHLLIEKPLSTTIDGTDQLLKEVSTRKLVAGVAYVLRCHPALEEMQQGIGSGRFGKPVHLMSQSGQHFPTYRPAYRNIYYKDRATGGGAIQDALTHTLNAAEWLIGPTSKVVADAAHQVLEGVSVEDTVNVIARHGDVLASYCLNQHQAPNESTLTVVCERGTHRWEFHRNCYRWLAEPGGEWQEKSFGQLERDQLFVSQAEKFLDALEGAPLICPLRDGLQTLRTNLAILKSCEARQWIALPSE